MLHQQWEVSCPSSRKKIQKKKKRITNRHFVGLLAKDLCIFPTPTTSSDVGITGSYLPIEGMLEQSIMSSILILTPEILNYYLSNYTPIRGMS